MSFDVFSNDGDDLTRSNSRPFDDFDTNNGNTGGGAGYGSYGGIDDDYVAVSGGGGGADQSPFEFEDGVAVENEHVGGGGIYGFDQAVANGNGGLGYDDMAEDGPVLPPPNEMQEEGHALREWRRLNAIGLAEKELIEKEQRIQIILDAEEYIQAFYEKSKTSVESKKVENREKEKSYLATQEKFHKEADKQYWKAI